MTLPAEAQMRECTVVDIHSQRGCTFLKKTLPDGRQGTISVFLFSTLYFAFFACLYFVEFDRNVGGH